MSGADARVDAWADALRSEASDRGRPAGKPDVLVERRERRGDGAEPVVEIRVLDAAGDVSSVDLSPAETRRLAGQLTTAASGGETEESP